MKKIKTLEEFVAQVQSEKILAELKQLKKMEVKQFDKVLALYKSLWPRYYFAVKKAILNMKVADSTKEKMSHFNELILESCYTDFNFLEEAEGFAIGDKVYNSLDSQSNPKTITEIFEKDGDIFVWFLENAEVLDSPILIELISKTKQEEKAQSLVDMVENEESLIDSLNIMDITSTVGSFLLEYGSGAYDLHPVYQRNLVWSLEQKQSFIKSLFNKRTKVTPTFLINPNKVKDGYYEVLDGKQRISTILEFVKGGFAVEGFYFNDLSLKDIIRFKTVPFVYKTIKYYDKKIGETEMPLKSKIELFLQVNEYGEHVSQEHLEKIKNAYLQQKGIELVMDKKILEYIRNSKPNKSLKEALNELPEEISKYFSEGDRKRKEDEFAELWLRTEVLQEKRYRITIKGVGSVLKKNTSSDIWFFGIKVGDVGIYREYHTEADLRANGFGWAFDCEGVEIEEIG